MKPTCASVLVAALGCLVLLPGLGRAEVQVGASRDEVMEVLGPPQGVLQMDKSEWLLYPRGRIQIEGGRVVKVDLEEPAAHAQRIERERVEAEAMRRRQQAQRAARIERGQAERARLLADPSLPGAPAEARYRVWSDFQRSYPDVSAEPQLSQSAAEYRLELERRESDRRIAELERKVEEADRAAREAGSASSLIRRRYSYYPSVIPPLVVSGYGAYYPVVICPSTGRRLYAAPARGHAAAVPVSRNEWNARREGQGIEGRVRADGERATLRISF